MPYKQIRFSQAAYEWLERHKDISDLKIMNIAMHRSGELTLNKDGTYTLKSGIILHGKYTNLWLKVREREGETLTEVIVLKLHLGHLRDSAKF
ncbi:hypothetical protein A3K81_01075 [Candidatus Bathyarchaeota archaeon RBG_13_60_20]|nr:MAG: hypothetical protein A3K81_01075 [Candidatus Bathyarchaeota archaeon RBG_13_60_20]